MEQWVILLASVSAFLYSCGAQPKENPAFKPVLNAKPKYFITYKGFVDPSLSHLIKLKILTVYGTTNPKCQLIPNKLSGVGVPRERLHYTEVKPDAGGRFSYRVALDKYLPGVCGWDVSQTSYNDQGSSYRDDFASAEWFSSNKAKAVSVDKEHIDFSCTQKKCTPLGSTNIVVIAHKLIPSYRNHTLEFNYVRSR